MKKLKITPKTAVWPSQYFQNPNPDVPVEKVWEDMDAHSFEEQFEQEYRREHMDFVIPLPPFNYKGKITKGLFYSQSVDVILSEYPDLKKIFIPIANSMFCSYPQSDYADAYFTCYRNKKREDYFKKKHPEKKDIVMLPLQDADFTNEYSVAPAFNVFKTIDVLCITTAFPVKNMPMIAKALKAYEKKYNKILKVTYAIGNRDAVKLPDGSMDYTNVRDDAKDQLREVDNILGDTKKYIDFHPYIEYSEITKYYTAAKCCVLGSLMEGKNRFISEAMCCNTPIIVFRDFNKFARGDYPVFFGNSGEYAPQFTPESLADTIFKVINFPERYEPRKNYLMYNGRKNFINTCTDAIPYFRENIPGFVEGRIHENIWVDLACQANYQLSYYDFLYGKNPAVSYVRGMTSIGKLIDFFYARFSIKPE